MSEATRANCPLTGLHCEGRQALIDTQTRLSVEAAAMQPNIVTDDDGPVFRVAKHLANMASSTATHLCIRGAHEFSKAIDGALSAAPAMACTGSLCGTLGNLVIAYGETFMPESYTYTVRLGKKE